MEATAAHLLAGGDEWFAVCYFYASYHLVKAAMMVDPIFGNPTDLSTVDVNLTPASRWTTHHQGRVQKGGPRDFGINDIVVKLYNDISIEYRRLHMASVNVRYSSGLGVIAPTTVQADWQAVRSAYDAGTIVYTP